ncbi:uncharacterized protein LOC119277885 isoform X1 [Triticum dicoccoides]|uniref:uncharacterized protein LOC119277885 isoform X1 n=1 Tax=Triticum dicoccoides TaxID=85692 RepID=UPI00188E4057|nr:uncharacterized protein LOC119277885 isoform X1 [Triticum dicoccoides]XP_037415124.1 uncharacterized protein LOC119277885 isoform X1 [Triticum dicoccoides]
MPSLFGGLPPAFGGVVEELSELWFSSCVQYLAEFLLTHYITSVMMGNLEFLKMVACVLAFFSHLYCFDRLLKYEWIKVACSEEALFHCNPQILTMFASRLFECLGVVGCLVSSDPVVVAVRCFVVCCTVGLLAARLAVKFVQPPELLLHCSIGQVICDVDIGANPSPELVMTMRVSMTRP